MTAVEPSFRDQWVAELERLEADVELAESMLKANETPVLPDWQPPVVREPLPSDLEPRARLVLERQLAVAYFLTERLTATAKERQLTQRIRETTHPDIPVYVDLNA
jgi:hypothetical protein